jgi:hypothetical protein
MYLAHCTRIDLSFTFGKLARFTHKFGKEHWNALLRVVGYLMETKDLGLRYEIGMDMKLTEYSDADWTVRSTAGFVILMGNEPVAWKSWVIKSVALNTMESEYYGLAGGVKELKWISMLWEELQGKKYERKIICYVDNNSCIELAGKPKHREKAKHIDIRMNFIRDEIEMGKIELKKIGTHDNVADILTKPLGKAKHQQHTQRLMSFPNSRGVKNNIRETHEADGRLNDRIGKHVEGTTC